MIWLFIIVIALCLLYKIYKSINRKREKRKLTRRLHRILGHNPEGKSNTVEYK